MRKALIIGLTFLPTFALLLASQAQATVDTFGISELYPTQSGGHSWDSTAWNNGVPRTLTASDDSPYDPTFDIDHGDGSYFIDGTSSMTATGPTLRMYAHQTANTFQWRDVEATMYMKWISGTMPAYSGLEMVARTNHQVDANLCDTRGIDARIRSDGHIDFEKETSHPDSVAINDTAYQALNKNQWIGYKLIVYDVAATGKTHLELWTDLSTGTAGGSWTKLEQMDDDGTNFGIGGTACHAGEDPKLRLSSATSRSNSETGKPNASVYWRADSTSGDIVVAYKWVSVREITVSTNVPVISPSTTSVVVGGTVQFTSTDTVTWSMVAGSTGAISAGGLYTAPANGLIQAKNQMEGCQLLPNDHLYNTDISSLPVDANSATRIANILGGTSGYIQIEPDFRHNVMFNTTPTTTTVSLNTSNNDGAYSMLPFPYTGVENDLLPSDYFAQDRHIGGVNTDTCEFSEFYNFYPLGKNGSCPTCNTQGNVKYLGTSYALPDNAAGNSGGGVDAAGMYIQPLLLRYSELKAGHIDHALRFQLANGYIQSAFIWPGVANATPGCTPSANCVPYGARFRLKASYDITPYSATTQTILKALKKYGMFMTDGGTSMHISAEADVFSDTTTYTAIQSEIRFGTIASQWAFDQVDESSLMVSTATGKVKVPNVSTTVPSNYAVVMASKTSDHTTAQVYVALQPVTVGTYNPAFQANGPAISVMAGTPQFQIPVIVNGSATKTATCSMSPTIGSITSGCLYTAPASGVRSASTTVVTMTATVDSTATINFPLTIFSSDAIRVNVGGYSDNITTPTYDAAKDYGPDATGKVWATDPAGIGFMNSTKQDSSFSPSLWISSRTDADIGLFYNQWPGLADGAYSAMVPNGNYSLLMGFSAGDPGNNSMSGFNQSIDTQGTTIFSTSSFRTLSGNTNYVSVSTTVPVTVTNNQFYFAMREVDYSSHTLINKWSLTLDSLAPSASTGRLLSGTGSLSGKGAIQ